MSGERSRNLAARDAANVWHPFTQHAQWLDDDPLVIDRAEGMYLFDAEGRRYLDGISSLWVTVHGHKVPEIDNAIRNQLDRLDHSTFLGFTHEPGIELAEKLLSTAPSPEPGSGRAPLSKVFYAGDGASAVEAAIKMAFQAKAQQGEDRPYYLHVAEGYHGDTLGAVSVGGIDLFHHTYKPILLETLMVSSPGVLSAEQTRVERAGEVLAELSELLGRHGSRTCAIVVEPMVQAAGGMLTHDSSFLRGVRDLADTHGAYLVADEVATGVGRTGRMWAVEHADVVPDLLTCGKGITGGYLPLSAVLATDEIYGSFLGDPGSGRTFFHGHSYTANPLCAAAAIANLDLMTDRNTVSRAEQIGERIGQLTKPLADHPAVREIRRIGTMTGIEVTSNRDRTGFDVCRRARDFGVILRPLGDVVVLMPPLAMPDELVDELVAVTERSITDVAGKV
ncbi:MAG TPA: adenosylmethionine--8-amino-7-oxononanoate transaminase [Actinomycetes bacterium]|nr:adenosylmethionine--8-amino-7-oxononanoate transaminase [Actinomycetes bacterium]